MFSTKNAIGVKPLSPREREAVALLAAGMTDKEVAGSMRITTRTVRAHLRSVQTKLACRTRLAAIVRACLTGAVTLDNGTSANSAGKLFVENYSL